MAEGLLRHLAGDQYDVYSAGTEATFVRANAIEAMREIGIDISGQTSKTMETLLEQKFDYVVTVCDAANETCPVFPGGTKRMHWSLEDPSKGDLELFRRVRDQIRAKIREAFEVR
jgi:arsenate reductase